jgi:hypothetical protein
MNIFHIYQMEILEIQRLFLKGIYIHHLLLTNFDPTSQVHAWRVNILQYLVKNIYVNDNSIKHKIVKNAPRTVCCLLHPIMLQVHFRWTNYNTVPNVNDKQDINMIEFFEHLKQKMNIHCELHDIIFVNRKGVRKVLDLTTRKPLEELLTKIGIKCAYFEDLTAQEQIDFVKNAKIFISPHSSALTNMIFTHKNCKIVEISSRKNWFCEPMCFEHKNNMIADSVNCKSKTIFFKYDFHHQSLLLNKKHFEYVCDDYIFVEPKSHHHKTNLVDTIKLLTFIKSL